MRRAHHPHSRPRPVNAASGFSCVILSKSNGPATEKERQGELPFAWIFAVNPYKS